MNLNQPPKTAFDAFLRLGIELESEILEAGLSIRDQSKAAYKDEWLDSRLVLLSIIRFTHVFRSGIPGKTNESISNRLQLIIQYAQGVGVTESTISEGLYVKANAVLKQDYEILTRIREYKINAAKIGKTPNVKHAPAGSQQFYGELNSVAHPSNPHLLSSLSNKLFDGEISGVSSCPIFIKEVACSHYELHLWITLEIARESISLATEMYPDAMRDLYPAVNMFLSTVKNLESVGFTSE